MLDIFRGSLQTINFVESTTKPPVAQVVVEVQNRNITLPENKATLTAFSIPEPPPGVEYDYEWILLSKQKNGEMENARNQTLSLTHLEEGTYQFQVTVTGGRPPGVHGVGLGNVTVLPRKQ